MTKEQVSTIDRDHLEQRIAAHSLNNEDRSRGFALGPASDNVAGALVTRGFRRVYDYAGGLTDWQQGGYPIASSPSMEDAPTLPAPS
jgi:rhodanese-related sulfurtransferase